MARHTDTPRGSAGPFTAATQPYALAAFRIVTGGLFACHGAASLFGVMGSASGSDGGTVAQFSWPGWYAAVIQLGCGALVLLGLGTRAAAFLASGSMAYAYFSAHQPQALWPLQNDGELSVLFCWAFFLLVCTGPGALGADRLFTRGKRRAAAADARRDGARRDGGSGPSGRSRHDGRGAHGDPGLPQSGSGQPPGGNGQPHSPGGRTHPVGA